MFLPGAIINAENIRANAKNKLIDFFGFFAILNIITLLLKLNLIQRIN